MIRPASQSNARFWMVMAAWNSFAMLCSLVAMTISDDPLGYVLLAFNGLAVVAEIQFATVAFWPSAQRSA